MSEGEEEDSTDSEDEGDSETDSDDESSGHGPLPFRGMGYERSTTSRARAIGTTLSDSMRWATEAELERSADIKLKDNTSAADSVRALLRHRFGSCVHGWREAMDQRAVHSVGQVDFFKTLRDLGFVGDQKVAWSELLGTSMSSSTSSVAGARSSRRLGYDKQPKLTLAHIDPEVVQVLANFHSEFVEAIGPLHSSLLHGCDGMRVGKQQFMRRCAALAKPRFDKPAMDLEAVWGPLQSHGSVAEADVLWLEDLCRRDKKAGSSEQDLETVRKEHRQSLVRAGWARAAEDLRRLLQHRHGSILAGWRKGLDPDGNGELTEDELTEALERLRFKGKAADVWDALVADDVNVLKLKDLEPGATKALDAFKAQCIQRYGSLEQAFKKLDAKLKPLVSRQEFFGLCREIRFGQNQHLLFDFLDEKQVGSILLTNIDEQATHQAFTCASRSEAERRHEALEPQLACAERPTLQQRAQEQCSTNNRPPEAMPSCRQALLEVLEKRWGSPVRAWGRILDPQQKGKVKTDKFLVGCAAAGYAGSKTLLLQELGLKEGSSVRLKDIAPEAVEDCKEFKMMAGDKLSGIIKSKEENGRRSKELGQRVTKADFVGFCQDIGYTQSTDRLFKHLDVGASGTVNTKALRVLAEGRNEEKAVPGMVKKMVEVRKSRWQKKLSSQAVPPKRHLLGTQDDLLRQGREHRAAQVASKDAPKQFLRKLEAEVGSVARAWRLAFDPDNEGEVNFEQFLEGAEKAGFVNLEQASDETIRRMRQAFDSLANPESGLVTLECMDPRTPAALAELRCRCVDRYGGVVEAFLEIDPEGKGTVSAHVLRQLCQAVKMADGSRRLLEYLDPEDEDEVLLELIDKRAANAAKDVCWERDEAKKARLREDERNGRMHLKREAPLIGVSVGVEARREQRSSQPGQWLLGEFKKRLIAKHGTLVNAWRKVLSPDGKRRIGLNDFEETFKQIGLTGDPKVAWSILIGPSQVPEDAHIRLVDLDPGIDEDLQNLRTRLVERYGSIQRAIEEVDCTCNCEIDLSSFLGLCYECNFRGNERRLFSYFDSKETGKVAWTDIDRKATEAVKSRRAKAAPTASPKSSIVSATPVASVNESIDMSQMKLEESMSAPSGAGSPTKRLSISSATETRDASLASPSRTLTRDPCKAFRDLLARRFTSMIQAWRMIDREDRVALTKQEFTSAVASTGYSGHAAALWTALVGEEGRLLSIRELDPELFKLLAEFRRKCEGRGGLRKVFEDKTGKAVKRFEHEGFLKLCKKLHCPRLGELLFVQLDGRNHGSITWDSVRFLEEQWQWDPEEVPLRSKPGSLGQSRSTRDLRTTSPGLLGRTIGEGPMMTHLKPKRVSMQKANSLPTLMPRLRDNWNDRHHVVDTAANKDVQLLHLVTQVMTKDKERIRRRVERKIQQVPTHQWLEGQNRAAEMQDEEEYSEGDYV